MVPMYSKWPPKLPSDTPSTKWLGVGVGLGWGDGMVGWGSGVGEYLSL